MFLQREYTTWMRTKHKIICEIMNGFTRNQSRLPDFSFQNFLKTNCRSFSTFSFCILRLNVFNYNILVPRLINTLSKCWMQCFFLSSPHAERIYIYKFISIVGCTNAALGMNNNFSLANYNSVISFIFSLHLHSFTAYSEVNGISMHKHILQTLILM